MGVCVDVQILDLDVQIPDLDLQLWDLDVLVPDPDVRIPDLDVQICIWTSKSRAGRAGGQDNQATLLGWRRRSTREDAE